MKRSAILFLLILATTAGRAAAQQPLLSPAPGSYDHPILLSLSPPSADQAISYRIDVEGAPPADRPLIPYTAPLYLSALPDQERTYRLTVQLRKGEEPISTNRSVYTIDLQPRAGSTPSAGAAARPTAAAPGGPAAAPTSIPVLSPVAGTFGNRQLLYIMPRDFAWVRYTLDGSDPVQQGTPYETPHLIAGTGKIDLRIAALVKGASTPLTARVQFAVNPAASAPLGASSGELSAPLTLSPPKSGRFFYTFASRPPGLGDPPFERPLVLDTPPGSVAYTALQLRSRKENGTWGTDFRYFFAIDRRAAPQPVIEHPGGKYLNARSVIRILDAPYTDIYYTTDGTTPDRSKERYRGPFTPVLPASGEGTLTVRARAYAPNGTASEVATAKLPFSTQTPATPEVSVTRGGADTGGPDVHVVVKASAGSTVVYERTLDGTSPENPTISSPHAPSEMALSVPRGANVVFSLRFAAVDVAGNISRPSKMVQTRVNAYPPAPPTIDVSDGTLTLSGTGTIRYTLTDSGAQPAYPGPTAPAYTGPIPLSGKANERVEYLVAAVCTGSGGQPSDVSRGGPYVVDRRSPPPAGFWGVAAGGIYNEDRSVSVAEQSGIRVRYTLSSDGTPPPDPGPSSRLFSETMHFSVPDGAEKSYVLKLRSFIAGRPGPVVTIPFTIDRIPPVIPPVDGLEKNRLADRPVTIAPPRTPPGETLFIATSEEGTPADPLGADGRPFHTPIRFSAPSGQRRVFHIRLAARDAAGNTAGDPTDYLLTIDRRFPQPPTINAAPQGATAEGAVTVTLEGTAASYRYELTSDGADPPMPTASSPVYDEPIVLPAVSGRTTLYTLYAIGESASGVLSRHPAIYRVLVSPAAASPEVASGGEPAGSAPATGSTSGGSLLTGAKEDGLYDSARTLSPAKEGEVLRYTLDPNGGDPPPVGRFSQRFPERLLLDPLPGETRHYAIRVASFASADSALATGQQLLRFTIDRTPPEAPAITGIAENARYQHPQTFTLEAKVKAVYYSIEKLASLTPGGSAASASFRRYTGPLTIGKGESWAVYRIRAYSVDDAGNRSLHTPEWTVYFDSGVVYASPEGSDTNDGSSGKPVKSLDHALELARTEGRGAVFLATGRYELGTALKIDSGIGIVGDFDPNGWHRSAASEKTATVVTVPADAQSGPLFTIDGGALSIDRIDLHDERSRGSLIRLTRGSFGISNASMDAADSAGAIIATADGSVTLDHATLDNRGGGAVVSLRHTTAQFLASSFTSAETTDNSILLSIAGGSKVAIANSIFHASAGLRTISIETTGSDLQLSGSQLHAGTATRQSIGLYAVDSKITVADSQFEASPLSHLSFGIQAQGSSLAVSGSSFRVAGTTGATGIWADGSHLLLERSQIRGASTTEFLYLVKLTDSPARITGNILRGAATGDFLGISLTRSQGRVVGNTLFEGTGSGRSSAIALDAAPDVDIVDNILARSSAPAGQAVSVRSASGLPRIIANDISGYRDLLAQQGSLPIESVDGLNGADGKVKGGPIAGNITEAPGATFIDSKDLRLRGTSACVGAGVDPAPYGGILTDYAGTTRSAPFDIGALRH